MNYLQHLYAHDFIWFQFSYVSMSLFFLSIRWYVDAAENRKCCGNYAIVKYGLNSVILSELRALIWNNLTVFFYCSPRLNDYKHWPYAKNTWNSMIRSHNRYIVINPWKEVQTLGISLIEIKQTIIYRSLRPIFKRAKLISIVYPIYITINSNLLLIYSVIIHD